MTDKLKQPLENLELKVKLLMSFSDSLYEENIRLKEELTKRNAEFETISSELSDVQTKYANLKLSKAFASGDKEEVKKAKTQLSKLVQDVDKCIFLLKQ